jgi:hypothetical protein
VQGREIVADRWVDGRRAGRSRHRVGAVGRGWGGGGREKVAGRWAESRRACRSRHRVGAVGRYGVGRWWQTGGLRGQVGLADRIVEKKISFLDATKYEGQDKSGSTYFYIFSYLYVFSMNICI